MMDAYSAFMFFKEENSKCSSEERCPFRRYTASPCSDRSIEGVEEGAAQIKGFVYRRLQRKYCLRRSHASTCVQDAQIGAGIPLRRPWQPGTCLRHVGPQHHVQYGECNSTDDAQIWVFHSRTGTFRPALSNTLCLDLFNNGKRESRDKLLSLRSALVQGTYSSHGRSRDANAEKFQRDSMVDGGSSLGSWPCTLHASNERFIFDRYMGRYCVASDPSVCVVEAITSIPMKLRIPNSFLCLQHERGLAMLVYRRCNASDVAQLWIYDESSLVFRHAADPGQCIDYFSARKSFGVWPCNDGQEVNNRQRFRLTQEHERFCLWSSTSDCLQEATSSFLY